MDRERGSYISKRTTRSIFFRELTEDLARPFTTMRELRALAVNRVSKKSGLPIEVATFLDLFFGAASVWILFRLGRRVRKGRTNELDNHVLRMLSRSDDPATPVGPKWLPDVAGDITALGSGANLSLATAIVVGTLFVNRRVRAAGFLVVFLGSGCF
jgi:hypothetical protein